MLNISDNTIKNIEKEIEQIKIISDYSFALDMESGCGGACSGACSGCSGCSGSCSGCD